MRDRDSKTGEDATGPDAPPDGRPDPAVETNPESTEARIDGDVAQPVPDAPSRLDDPVYASEARLGGEEPLQGTSSTIDDPAERTDAPVGASGDGTGTQAYHDEHDEEEAGGRSFATYALVALLLLIAGAALALWAAPRIAPNLPSGMAPVAEWLTPGATAAEERVAALEAEIAALRQEVAQEPDPAAADARIAELEASLDQRLATLQEEVAAAQGAGGGEQLAQLEAAVEGQAAALASLRDQFASVNAEGVTAQIDVYQAELEGLRGEVRELAGQVGTLTQRLDEATAAASRQVEEAEARVAEASAAMSTTERQAALSVLRTALTSGAPYADAVNALMQEPGVAIRQELVAPADTGLPTMDELRDRFPEAAHQAIRASIVASAGDGVLARARAFAEAQVASRSLTPQEGSDPDAVLSRMEAALRNDDLGRALAEAEALPSEASAAMEPWLADARTLAAAVEAYQELEAELSATN